MEQVPQIGHRTMDILKGGGGGGAGCSESHIGYVDK